MTGEPSPPNTMLKVVACIPAYREGSSIVGVIFRAQDHVDGGLVCDDGSMDLTGAIAGGLGAMVIRQEQNMVYGILDSMK